MIARCACNEFYVFRSLIRYPGTSVANADAEYLVTDRLGSVIARFRRDGSASAINAYDEYGVPGPSTGVLNNGRFRYTGQIWLPEAGLYYYKARMYSPTTGRFMQTDPIGYADGMNLYRYVGNDPVNRIDPTGTDYCSYPPNNDGDDTQEECEKNGGEWFKEEPEIKVTASVITYYLPSYGGGLLFYSGDGAVRLTEPGLYSFFDGVLYDVKKPQNNELYDHLCGGPVGTIGLSLDIVAITGFTLDIGVYATATSNGWLGDIGFYADGGLASGLDVGYGLEVGSYSNRAALNGQYTEAEGGFGPIASSVVADANGNVVGNTFSVGPSLPVRLPRGQGRVTQGSGSTAGFCP